ncbi:hypothetical protein HanXRQr2_Chr09g0375011 [Helianthus annuus]|uniref:Uncharacterized protein n=1 Tax=Helianthus annuus TaxID=4232 RepID=A0A9K3N725_HELAN|nr:hypothetical protein HanXRQr2_Chr09g0375011 [Helianthus annuus]
MCLIPMSIVVVVFMETRRHANQRITPRSLSVYARLRILMLTTIQQAFLLVPELIILSPSATQRSELNARVRTPS